MAMGEMTRRGFLAGAGAAVAMGAFVCGCSGSNAGGGGAVAASAVDVSTLDEAGRERAREAIRCAIRLLFDRTYVCDDIAQAGQIPANTFVPRGVYEPDGTEFAFRAGEGDGKGYYDPSQEALESNFDEAVSTLRQYFDFDEATGKVTNFPKLTYLYSTGEANKAMAEYFQSALATVGIDLSLENQERATFMSTCANGHYEVAYSIWIMDYTDPISMLNMWTSTSGTDKAQFGKGNHKTLAAYNLDLTNEDIEITVRDGTWAETYDVLINTINHESDQERRFRLMHLAEDIIMSTGCICPIYYHAKPYLLSDRVEGVWVHALGDTHFSGCTVDGRGDSISVCYGPEPATLDPALNTSLEGGITIGHCFSGIARTVPDGDGFIVAPDCATELVEPQENGDGTYTYTYTLRDDLTWSDGQPLTAHDFEFAWRRAASKELGAAYEEMFNVIAGYADGDLKVRAIDDVTLEVTSDGLIGYWDQLMAFPAFFPVRADVVATESWSTRPDTYICNGAYEMAEWEHNSHVVLRRRDGYHHAEEVKMGEIRWYLSDSANTCLNNFEDGDWLYIQDIPTNEMNRVKRQYGSEYHVAPLAGTFYVCWNVNKELLPA